MSVYKMNEPIDSVEGYIKIRYGINQTKKKNYVKKNTHK